MKLFKKLKYMVPLSFASIGFFPLFTSCSTISHINFLTNYINSLDATSMLGIAPDYYLNNISELSHEQFYNQSYLEKAINRQLTSIKEIPIMDGKEVNIKGISRLNPYAILFNEWEKVDEHKFKDIIPNIAYTSMGDTENKSRWWSDDTEKEYWFKPDPSMHRFYKSSTGREEFDYQSEKVNGFKNVDSGVSPQKALLMAAQDLDRIYGLDGKLEKRANDINLAFKKRVANITSNEYFRTFAKVNSQKENATNNETIPTNLNVGIIIGGTNDNNTDFKFLTPNALPLFYSQQVGKGLGFNFPDPSTNTNEWRKTRYGETFITGKAASNSDNASSSNELLSEFDKKFDYLIYVQSTKNAIKGNTPNLSGFTKLLKEDKSTYAENLDDKRIYKTTYMKFYDAIWGMYGYNYLLDDFIDEMLTQFASVSKTSNNQTTTTLQQLQESDKKLRLNFIPKEQYISLRKEIDVNEFKEWNYNRKENEESNL